MIPFGPKIKLAIIAVVVAAIGYAGWMARGWFEDSKDLAAMEAQQALVAEVREGQRQISAEVEKRLANLKANERIIDRGVIREIQKPIYQRVCFEPELVRLLNSAARGEAPREPAGEGADSTAADE
ncbi:hypothetical protein [Marinobacter sp. JSM 1782161]|uniref:hypothetical protein n=1 Tax=Marinobacter sp. JSM 1782161 TaxID=2685906 RepID=UPI001401DE24|nr:hypothetical protein [Marinobacter sp. JSM 1782161]